MRADVLIVVKVDRERRGSVDYAHCRSVIVDMSPAQLRLGMNNSFSLRIMTSDNAARIGKVGQWRFLLMRHVCKVNGGVLMRLRQVVLKQRAEIIP